MLAAVPALCIPINKFEQTAIPCEPTIQELIATMDLPSNRKSVRNVQDIQWLLRNINVRNQGHRHYHRAHSLLLTLARQQHAFKTSEIRKFADEINLKQKSKESNHA